MARIVVGSYMVRYPLGGMMSYVLRYLVGFQRWGHDVDFAEKAGYDNSCYDPSRDAMTDDCTYGAAAVNDLLERFGLGSRWCFVDAHGQYFGMPRTRIEDAFRTADLFLDMGTHGAWLGEATGGIRVLLDGEPGFTQMKMAKRQAAGELLPHYDRFYTVGRNIGNGNSSAPTAGRTWGHLWHPVLVGRAEPMPRDAAALFTTVMNWQSHDRLEFNGQIYGQKDVEFEQFIDLPRAVSAPMEIAVAGKGIPLERLRAAGWRVRRAHSVTSSFDSFNDYIHQSRAEFSVCKHVFTATNSGWFSDRSAAYLASARPVVVEDTGFSAHVPTGRGVFAVRSVDEAADAITAIEGDYERHSAWALEIAREYFEATKILGRFLDEIGVPAAAPADVRRQSAC